MSFWDLGEVVRGKAPQMGLLLPIKYVHATHYTVQYSMKGVDGNAVLLEL